MKQSFLEHFRCLLMNRYNGHPRFDQGYGFLLGIQHQLVDCSLLWSESSVNGDGSGNVSSVIIVLGSDIHQQKFTILDLSLALLIVQSGGIGAGCDNGGKSPVK